MTARTDYVIRRRLRSPRSAAIAGIIYAILMIAGMVLVYNITTDLPADITREWLDAWSDRASVAVTLTPFAGIAFLWFTGVVRDRLGGHEDQLFATIFLSSGIITVVLLFIWSAIFAALMRTSSLAAIGLADDDVYVFGFALMNRIVGDYTLRMAGVYMMGTPTGIFDLCATVGGYQVGVARNLTVLGTEVTWQDFEMLPGSSVAPGETPDTEDFATGDAGGGGYCFIGALMESAH